MAELTPLKAIRGKCLECSSGSLGEVRNCTIKKCPLFPYRFGKKPKGEENIEEDTAEDKNP